MHYDFKRLANAKIQHLSPYPPGKPIEELARETGIRGIIKLASNENPLGPSAKALEAAQNSLNHFHRYPDGAAYDLKQALSHHLNCQSDQITLGNGSDNVLRLIAKAYCQVGDQVVVSSQAFVTFSIVATVALAEVIEAPMSNWCHDLAAMAAAVTEKTKLVFIANPNNPTGTWVPHKSVETFLKTVPLTTLVVMDEAYFEYADDPNYPNSLALQRDYPNLIVTRTFSKIYGLAGLRVGYAISDPAIADILDRIRLPFDVSIPAQAAAIAALADEDYLKNSLSMNRLGYLQLVDGFERLNLSYIPSATNFLTVDVGQEGQIIYQALLKQGVIVRPMQGYGMPNHLRISIGLPSENDALLSALKLVLKG